RLPDDQPGSPGGSAAARDWQHSLHVALAAATGVVLLGYRWVHRAGVLRQQLQRLDLHLGQRRRNRQCRPGGCPRSRAHYQLPSPDGERTIPELAARLFERQPSHERGHGHAPRVIGTAMSLRRGSITVIAVLMFAALMVFLAMVLDMGR